jgi:hypothetical protein
MLPKRTIYATVVHMSSFAEELDKLDMWLNEMALDDNWCPDWEYTLTPVEGEDNEYLLDVRGEIECDSQSYS